jgi:hypothetical protein
MIDAHQPAGQFALGGRQLGLGMRGGWVWTRWFRRWPKGGVQRLVETVYELVERRIVAGGHVFTLPEGAWR